MPVPTAPPTPASVYHPPLPQVIPVGCLRCLRWAGPLSDLLCWCTSLQPVESPQRLCLPCLLPVNPSSTIISFVCSFLLFSPLWWAMGPSASVLRCWIPSPGGRCGAGHNKDNSPSLTGAVDGGGPRRNLLSCPVFVKEKYSCPPNFTSLCLETGLTSLSVCRPHSFADLNSSSRLSPTPPPTGDGQQGPCLLTVVKAVTGRVCVRNSASRPTPPHPSLTQEAWGGSQEIPIFQPPSPENSVGLGMEIRSAFLPTC